MPGIRRCEVIENCQPHNITGATWEYEGIKGDGRKPEEIDRMKGQNCIIVAGASNVYNDYEEARRFLNGKPYALLAVNDIGQFHQDNVYAIVTAHPEWAMGWLNWRLSKNIHNSNTGQLLNKPFIYSDQYHYAVDTVWSGLGNQVGTSGMLACLIAICMGFDKIILCGMPLDWSLGHFYAPLYRQFPDPILEHIVKKSWEYALNRLPTFKDKVRSMSGRSMAWCGRPDTEWLNDKKGGEEDDRTDKGFDCEWQDFPD